MYIQHAEYAENYRKLFSIVSLRLYVYIVTHPHMQSYICMHIQAHAHVVIPLPMSATRCYTCQTSVHVVNHLFAQPSICSRARAKAYKEAPWGDGADILYIQ